MGKKLMQVTDSIHGTIYLSELESELISTPYFYRLHDVYQSSTVYMTFPSNRTKRYEHSLGTMSLASRLLYSSVTNADKETKDVLFKELKGYFLLVANRVFESDSENLYFSQGNRDRISALFDKIQNGNEEIDFISAVRDSIEKGLFNDKSLGYYQYYPIECITDRDSNNTENYFLYRCLLQAVRIVALFHDVGHPPYSHIIEEVLSELYNKVESDDLTSWVRARVNGLRKDLNPYFSKDVEKAYNCKRLISSSSLIKAAPHERIGLSFLDYAINDVIPTKISNIASTKRDTTEKFIHILYYITIVEFAFAILTEINPFFKSFHKIVDGVLDSDRLDYIVRDSQNSGVDWGKIPYERIINSTKLCYLEKDNFGSDLSEDKKVFVVTFPQKITDDIEDLLLVRYKIFARINFHHRCIKTSMALQGAIRYLAIDYLKNTRCISEEIKYLWHSLSSGMGDKRMRTIQWNDSWLISVLNDALVKLHLQDNEESNTGIRILKDNLEEILLNKRTYFSLLKRGRDNSSFVKSILKKTNITKETLKLLQEAEYTKYIENKSNTNHDLLKNDRLDALDSITRISSICERLDLEELCEFIPLKGVDLKDIIDQELDALSEITNFATIINHGRSKNGLSKNEDVLDGIYLYNNDNVVLFDENFSLYPQVDAVSKNISWLYIYFVPKDENTSIEQLSLSILDKLASSVAEKLQQRFDELFPSTKLTMSDE